MKKSIASLLLLFAFVITPAQAAENPVVRLTTSLGVIELELYRDKAPGTVNNFLAYVKSGFYTDTIFHRVIPGFMIQGGGVTADMREKPNRGPIKNEANNGLKNEAGTIAMARTMDPHSAAAQFFINTVDNAFLDHKSQTPQGWGYCVFGKVTKGMDVVKKIEQTPTGNRGPHQNVPINEIVIKKAEIVSPAAKASGQK